MTILQRLTSPKKDRKVRLKRVDVVAEQVRQILSNQDQQLILMVRG